MILNEIQRLRSVVQRSQNFLLTARAQAIPCFCALLCFFWLEGLKDIRLAYAMTVHKSQGSEADNVIIPFPSAYEDLLTRNLLYTGVTRGKRTVCVIGAEETIRKCIENDPDENPKLMRHSTLEAHCRDLMANPPVYDVYLDEEEEPEPF